MPLVNVEIPEVEYIDPTKLRFDDDNPNRMSEKQLAALRESMIRWGFIVPVVTNKDLLVADGQQRAEVAMGLELTRIPVVRLPVEDVDRRLLRQVLNKLKGTHLPELDILEYRKIVDGGKEKDLKKLIDISEEELLKAVQEDDSHSNLGEQFGEPEEKDKDHVKCPKCGYEFNPENFKVESMLEEPEEEDLDAHIRTGVNRGLNKRNTVILDLEFETRPAEITDRVAKVGEAFGVGVDETVKFPVFKGLELSYDDTDLIYVTGDSGSGKTTFLRLLEKHESERDQKTLMFDSVSADEDEVVIDGLGGDADEAMKLLAAAGLSEAFLMMRRFRELSDGQKYRYLLAKMLSVDADIYFIDEFGATLDRVMAKVLAFNLQKWARRRAVMIVAASTHHDLIEDFNPDVLVFKGFGESTQIRYFEPESKSFSLVRDMKVETATFEDYEQLERFHYLGRRPGWIKNIFKLTYREKTIGVVMYVSPFMSVSLRNKALPRYLIKDKKELAEVVNAEIVRLSRIIIHPKFRGAGLAVKLVRETMPLTETRVVETVAAMARYNPFFEKAGMTRVGEMRLTKYQKNLNDTILKIGGDPSLMHSPKACREFCDGLNDAQREKLSSVLSYSFEGLYGQADRGRREGRRMIRKTAQGGLPALLGELIPTKRVYLYWENPNMAN